MRPAASNARPRTLSAQSVTSPQSNCTVAHDMSQGPLSRGRRQSKRECAAASSGGPARRRSARAAGDVTGAATPDDNATDATSERASAMPASPMGNSDSHEPPSRETSSTLKGVREPLHADRAGHEPAFAGDLESGADSSAAVLEDLSPVHHSRPSALPSPIEHTSAPHTEFERSSYDIRNPSLIRHVTAASDRPQPIEPAMSSPTHTVSPWLSLTLARAPSNG